ncbi:MAG: RNA 2',3'-cyclic phosphodiesterase [Candidatus Aenigmatarchaeota archaeon]
MRAFLGISIPEDLKPVIVSVQDRLLDFDIKQVEKENLHFNLKFFPEIDGEDVEKLKRVLADVCKQFEPFEINVYGTGAFPSRNYIKVVWIGVKDGYQTLAALADMIEKSLESIGYEIEEKFVPHLTLGRVRSGSNKNELLTLMKKLENVEIGKMKVSEIKLFESTLGPNGPLYEELLCIKLTG